MRRVALLIGADPTQMKFGPDTWLGPGDWTIEAPCDIRIHFGSSSVKLKSGESGHLKNPGITKVEFVNGATGFFTVYAVQR